jgi:aspartate/tyrosine/aromatic aminotransferase
VPKIASQIKYLIRSNYSNPPLQGERIVSTILKSPELSREWQIELFDMCERIKEMRKAFVASLLVQNNKHDFSYLHQQNGLFSFIGLNPCQVQRLRDEKGLYMPSSGRINLAGLNTKNIPYVSEAILAVM